MSAYSQTLAITLQKQPVRENDCFFTFYTREAGKVRALATGAKRIKSKLAGHLEPFGVVRISIAHGYYQTRLTAASRQSYFKNIAQNLELLSIAGSCLHLTDNLTKENHRDEIVYDLLEELLNILNQNPKQEKLKIIYSVFVLKLLTELGYKPELYNCLICKTEIKPEGNIFSSERGGLICPVCSPRADQVEGEPGTGVSADLIKLLRAAINFNFENFLKIKISNEQALAFNKLASDFLEQRS